tara:strand:- start:1836 stop:2360 length:525 start_codon:yes stop_codon:yes gene_type:complete
MDYLDVAACNYNENYLVYSDGSLYMDKYDKLKLASDNGKNSPYWSYCIPHPTEKDTYKKFYVHRLVAEHFIPNPDNLRDVHHIDSNPKNNDVSNLAWLSHKDNCAQKIYPHPLEVIKNRPNAYCYKSDRDYYVFKYDGQTNLPDIPKMLKYGKSLEEVIKFRDEYFACVADGCL